MRYKSSGKRLPNFLGYVNKVYGLSQTIDSMQDECENADVSPQTIFMSVFLCLLMRLGSFRQLEFEVKNGRIGKFLPRIDRETFCANTVGNRLESMSTDILEGELTGVPKKLRRNKAYGTASHPRTIGGLRISAVDGTEYFRSESIHCPECMEMHMSTKEGIKIHYVHRMVMMQTVGVMHS